MGVSRVQECSLMFEAYREEMNKRGYDFREANGQTIWPHYETDGGELASTMLIWVGPIGADIFDDGKWTKIKCNPVWEEIKPLLDALTQVPTP